MSALPEPAFSHDGSTLLGDPSTTFRSVPSATTSWSGMTGVSRSGQSTDWPGRLSSLTEATTPGWLVSRSPDARAQRGPSAMSTPSASAALWATRAIMPA